MEEKTCCCHKTKERSEDERRKLFNRLNRIEGQIRGIKGMLERDALSRYPGPGGGGQRGAQRLQP